MASGSSPAETLPHARAGTRPVLRGTAERRYHLALTSALLATVAIGFSRSFFLRPWFAEWAAVHSPPEGFFYGIHGLSFALWYVLLVAQPALVAARRLDWHRRLGWIGAGLGVAMVTLGTLGGLIAANRPGGFIDVPAPPLVFLVVPISDMVLFAGFAAAGIALRRRPQVHKRLMLLASIGMVEAAFARWPFDGMNEPLAGLPLAARELCTLVFLVPMVLWDVVSRGRVQGATVIGGIVLLLVLGLRFPLAGTEAWQAFARFAVGLMGS